MADKIDVLRLVDWIDDQLLIIRKKLDLDFSAKITAYHILIDLQEFVRGELENRG